MYLNLLCKLALLVMKYGKNINTSIKNLLHDVTRHASFRTLYVDVKICCIQIAEAPPIIKIIIINKNDGIEPSLLVCVRRTSEIIQNIFVEIRT